jgi:uncharacterized integral membrane protein (TIGR00698 family)
MSAPQATHGRLHEKALGAGLAIGLALIALLVTQLTREWLAATRHPPLSPILCAVVLGIAWRNLLSVDQRWLPGAQWVASALLRFGVALIGLRLTLVGLGAFATAALPVVLSCITASLLASALIGRALRIERPLRFMIAAGTAICGCTAVITVAPLTRASEADTSIALTCIIVLGATGMLLYPWLAHLALNNPRAVGIFLGTAIHDTSQVLGAAMIYTQQFDAGDAAPYAALTKLLRNLFLLLLAPFIAWTMARERLGTSGMRSLRLVQIVPPFLMWFVALAVLRTVGDVALESSTLGQQWAAALASLLTVSEALIVCGIAAIGLSVSLKDLRGVGWRALLAAFAVALTTGLCSLALTLASERLLLLKAM